MIHAFGRIGPTATLRLVMLAIQLQGSFAASVNTSQSLIAVFGLSDNACALALFASLLVSVTASIGVGILTDQRPSRWVRWVQPRAATPWTRSWGPSSWLPRWGRLFG